MPTVGVAVIHSGFSRVLLVFKLSDLSEPVGLWGGLTTPEKLFLRLIDRMTIRVSRRVIACSAVPPAFVKPRSIVVSGAKGCQFRGRHCLMSPPNTSGACDRNLSFPDGVIRDKEIHSSLQGGEQCSSLEDRLTRRQIR